MARSTPKGKTPLVETTKTTPSSWTWWHNLSSAKQHGLCLFFLFLVAIGFYAPALFSGKSVIGGDTVNWRATAEAMIDYREATGEEPLWATHVFAGMPGYLISFPHQIPQIDLVPTQLRAAVWPVSHFLFLLLGVYLLVFFLTRDTLSGVLAACAYGLTTYLPILLIAGHNTKFITLCFAPWLVLAFLYVLRKPNLLGGLFFAAILSINLRANHIQITYYFAFILGVIWLYEGIVAWRKKETKPFFQATGWLALGSVLGLLMVAQPYLSTFEYKNYSIRGASEGGVAGGLDWSYAMAWSQGVGEMVTLLIADAFGGGGATYWGPKTFTAGPHYVGGIVLLLALIALWRYRSATVAAVGLGTLLMMAFALGENFPLLNRLMYHYFPLFDAFRVPETWLSAVAFTLALLAGLGLFYLSKEEASDTADQAKTRTVFVACAAMLALMMVLILGKNIFFSFEKPDELAQIVQIVQDQRPDLADRAEAIAQQEIARRRPERLVLFQADALRTFLMLLLASGALVAYRKRKIPAPAMQIALVLLVVFDLAGVGRRYFNEDQLQPAKAPQDLIAEYDFDGFLLAKQQEAGGEGHFRVLSLEANPSTNARPSYFYESLGGYHGAKLRLYQDYLTQIFIDKQTGLPNDNALDLLNTRYIIAQGTLPGTNPVFTSETSGFYVLENPDAVDRAFLVGQVEVIDTPKAQWSRLQDQAFEPRQTAILATAIPETITPLDSTSTATVALQRFSPRHLSWSVETDASRLLVVSEVYYPAGWKAFVDGEPAPIYQADYLLRAVPVPAGSHTVEMRFEPGSYRASLWIAGLSTLGVYGGLLVLLGLGWLRQKKAKGVA